MSGHLSKAGNFPPQTAPSVLSPALRPPPDRPAPGPVPKHPATATALPSKPSGPSKPGRRSALAQPGRPCSASTALRKHAPSGRFGRASRARAGQTRPAPGKARPPPPAAHAGASVVESTGTAGGPPGDPGIPPFPWHPVAREGARWREREAGQDPCQPPPGGGLPGPRSLSPSPGIPGAGDTRAGAGDANSARVLPPHAQAHSKAYLALV